MKKLTKQEDVLLNFILNHKKDIHTLLEIFPQGHSVIETLNSLQKLKLVKKQSRELFKGFSLATFESSENHIKEIKSALNKNAVPGTKYEVRYFWPYEYVPEIIDLGNGLFDEKAYKYKETEDIYWMGETGDNIKVRGDELHIKKCLQKIHNIAQFSKKKKIKLPLKEPHYKEMIVRKQRYLRKFEDKTKIEFSCIQVNGKKWKTICFESKSLGTVLALSLLINPDHGESLTYSEFLKRL